MNISRVILGLFNIALFRYSVQDQGIERTYTPNFLDHSIILPKLHNYPIFLNYANNVFGISKVLQVDLKSNSPNNVIFVKGYPVRLPNFNNIRFDVMPYYNVPINISATEFAEGRQMRSKRGLVHLYNMISCATGCDPIKYKGYGCYCGFLGSGNAINAIDRCCQMHDKCYSNSGCLVLLEYVVPYLWMCYYNKPLCAIKHDIYGESSSCASRLCQCDKYLAECLRRFPCPHKRPICSTSPISAIQNIFLTIVN